MSLYESLMERMEGRQYRSYFSAFCPFDEHSKAALLVYEDGYVCLSCRKKGSLEYLDKFLGSHIRHGLTQSQPKVPQVLPRWRRWEQRHGSIEGIAQAAHKCLKRNPSLQNYLKKRKIYEFVDVGLFGYLDGWYLFPVFSHDQSIIDIVVRGGPTKKDARYVLRPDDLRDYPPLYVPNWERVIKAKEVFVVYGIIDSWAFEALGLPCVTGTTGKSLGVDILKALDKRYIIVPDRGEEREAYTLANRLGWKAQVKILRYVYPSKDPDSIRITFGNDKLLEMLTL